MLGKVKAAIMSNYSSIQNNVAPPKVANVEDSSLGIVPGDKIVSLNGQPIRDIIDWKWLVEAKNVIEVEHSDGRRQQIHITSNNYNLGIELDNIIFDGIKKCKNNCIFCFMKQLPQG